MSVPSLTQTNPYDQRLISNVHPPEWENPEPAPRYNLVVLGAGTAGLVSAAATAGLGGKVALVERELMGGDCLNVGCVPSKALIRAARAFSDARDAGAFGVGVADGVRVDFVATMERMQRLRAELSGKDSATRYRGLGVDVFLGEGRFSGPDSIEVGGKNLRFSRAVIASGSRAGAPPIPGLSEAGFLTNETIFSLVSLPKRLVVIGAGPVGCELAQAFRRFGADVWLLEAESGILPREDRDAAEIVRDAMIRDGVSIVEGCRIARVTTRDRGKVVSLECSGTSHDIPCNEILVGVGRTPNVEGLKLEMAGVAYDRRTGVQVNDHLRTTNRRIFAAGDVCSRYKFTHMSDAMARIVVRNALFLGVSE